MNLLYVVLLGLMFLAMALAPLVCVFMWKIKSYDNIVKYLAGQGLVGVACNTNEVYNHFNSNRSIASRVISESLNELSEDGLIELKPLLTYEDRNNLVSLTQEGWRYALAEHGDHILGLA